MTTTKAKKRVGYSRRTAPLHYWIPGMGQKLPCGALLGTKQTSPDKSIVTCPGCKK